MIQVALPDALRPHARGSALLRLEHRVTTVRDALDAVGSEWPGVRDRVLTEQGELRPHVNVFVDEESVRFLRGLDTPVPDGSTLTILPAVSGG